MIAFATLVFTVGICFVFVLLVRGLSGAAILQHCLGLLTGEKLIETRAWGKMAGLVPQEGLISLNQNKNNHLKQTRFDSICYCCLVCSVVVLFAFVCVFCVSVLNDRAQCRFMCWFQATMGQKNVGFVCGRCLFDVQETCLIMSCFLIFVL